MTRISSLVRQGRRRHNTGQVRVLTNENNSCPFSCGVDNDAGEKMYYFLILKRGQEGIEYEKSVV